MGTADNDDLHRMSEVRESHLGMYRGKELIVSATQYRVMCLVEKSKVVRVYTKNLSAPVKGWRVNPTNESVTQTVMSLVNRGYVDESMDGVLTVSNEGFIVMKKYAEHREKMEGKK
jgi:hypothetical protein